ncbi:AAA domain-containing protein [Blastococcus aurantiacus]|uniref:AAA domain-containing protein n=1 Tax=Blastococcus aurantiacus TaxID=1550231 RepID=A0A1G7JB61_9ACTN|nr:AAA family ATPase [Blastococcus aurantiacus]SDF22207.1 AAA domain-containing protein [Blastococcus aurantiacus]
MDGRPHLIVLRGNSASGKTTIAAALQRALGRGTANIGQDHFRRVVLREHDTPGADNIGLIAHTIRYCTGRSYNVIAEGIFVADHYRDMLREVIAEHPGPTHVFYLDVPLEETVRRHMARPLGTELPVDKLREWYVPSDTLGVPGEVVLDGAADLATTVQSIRDVIGPVPTRPAAAGARFR